jgi:hypothetical protein
MKHLAQIDFSREFVIFPGSQPSLPWNSECSALLFLLKESGATALKSTSALAVAVWLPILIDSFVWALPIDIYLSTQRELNVIFSPLLTVPVQWPMEVPARPTPGFQATGGVWLFAATVLNTLGGTMKRYRYSNGPENFGVYLSIT